MPPDAPHGFIPPIQQGSAACRPPWAQVLIYATSPLPPHTAEPDPSVSHGEAPRPTKRAKSSFYARLASKTQKPHKSKEQLSDGSLVESVHGGRRRAGITPSQMISVLN